MHYVQKGRSLINTDTIEADDVDENDWAFSEGWWRERGWDGLIDRELSQHFR